MPDRNDIRVLLIDDDEDAYLLVRSLLRRGGRYRVEWVSDVGDARAALAAGEHDVCLLDYSLENCTGIELLESVGDAIDPDAPVILLTARWGEDADRVALEHGVSDFVVKDRIDSYQLRRSIRYALERARTLAELRETQERYALAVAGSRDGIWDWDLRHGRVYFSPRWKGMLGYHEDEVADSIDEWVDRVHADDRQRLREALGAHIDGESEELKLEYRMLHADGGYRWMQTRARAVRDRLQRAVRIAGSQTDITEDRLIRERLAHKALHDDLTGLPNRALFLDRVHHCIQRGSREPDAIFAVLFLDLDRFKVVNDSLGHATGDTLLVEVSKRLVQCLRPGDSVARLGGDEFAVLVDRARAEHDVIRVVERIQLALEEPVTLVGRQVFARASIGIAFGNESYVEAGDVLRDADAAMYKAKQRGPGHYQVFDASVHSQALEHLEVESDLRRGFERREFIMYYQPIVSIPERRLVGLEALMRWNHPDRGVLPPSEFLPLADEIGLLPQMERAALHSASHHLRRWCEQLRGSGRELALSINLCGRHLRDPSLASSLRDFLRRSDLLPSMLKLEITEDTVMRGDERIGRNLADLGEMEIRMYVDDFGTGYSSLGRLRELPVDTLKIDRSFVSRIHVDSGGREIVRAVVTLARSLGLDVIAEGTETEEQLDQLRDLQCDRCQGFLFSEPLPARDVEPIVAAGVV